MKISDLYPSKFIKSDDLQGRSHRLTIMSVTVEEISDTERKPVLRFMRHEKGLVLNKTNATHLAQAFGDDTIMWQGLEVDLVAMPTTFNGKPVQGIVVMPVSQPARDPSRVYQEQDAQQRDQFRDPGPYTAHQGSLDESEKRPALIKGKVQQDMEDLSKTIDQAEKAAGINVDIDELPF